MSSDSKNKLSKKSKTDETSKEVEVEKSESRKNKEKESPSSSKFSSSNKNDDQVETNNKKKLPHQDDNDESPKIKRNKSSNAESSNDINIKEIHTANNWEQADLGDEKRKMKFLKLMGAGKHKNDPEVAHQHARTKTDTVKINTELEKQFNEGLHTNMNRSHHVGLGFGGSSGYSGSGVTTKSTLNTRKTFDDDDDDTNKQSSTTKIDDKSSSAKSDAKSKYSKLGFVKSSS